MNHDIEAVVAEYAQRCFLLRTAPRVDELARELAVHPSFLSRYFKKETGRGLSAVLKDHQIAKAKELLRGTALSLDEIAVRAGFGTRNTLFRCFRRFVGTTPHRYRTRCDTTV